VREADALAREAIQARRREVRLTVGAEIAVAEVVGLDQDDVRPRLRLEARPVRQDREAGGGEEDGGEGGEATHRRQSYAGRRAAAQTS
jgi:hypothetical protein